MDSDCFFFCLITLSIYEPCLSVCRTLLVRMPDPACQGIGPCLYGCRTPLVRVSYPACTDVVQARGYNLVIVYDCFSGLLKLSTTL